MGRYTAVVLPARNDNNSTAGISGVSPGTVCSDNVFAGGAYGGAVAMPCAANAGGLGACDDDMTACAVKGSHGRGRSVYRGSRCAIKATTPNLCGVDAGASYYVWHMSELLALFNARKDDFTRAITGASPGTSGGDATSPPREPADIDETDFRNQALKAEPAFNGGARTAHIVIDHRNHLPWPAELVSAIRHRVPEKGKNAYHH